MFEATRPLSVSAAGQHCGEQGEKGGAHRDEQIGANAGRLATDFAFQSDDGAEQTRQQQSANCAVRNHHLLQAIEIERLDEIGVREIHARVFLARCYHRTGGRGEDYRGVPEGEVSDT